MTFLKKRENTHVEFPFYWGGIIKAGQKKPIKYEAIIKKFKDDDNTNFKEVYEFCKDGTIIPSLEMGDMHDVILKLNKTDEKNHFSFFRDILLTDDYSYVCNPLFQVLRSIKIAHINFPFKEVNSQSAIVEIKMPKLGMQFFLTGDAHEETFALINMSNSSFFRKDPGFTSLVMLPHHGSLENKSNYIFTLFQPDILGISAGNGGQYGHPSKKLIGAMSGLKSPEFWDKFSSTMCTNYLVEYEKENKKYKAFLHKNSNQKMPFVCTNFLGNIKINENGIFAQFSNFVEQDGKCYEVDFYKQAVDIEPTGDGLIRLAEGNFYFCLENEQNKTVYYKATEKEGSFGEEAKQE